jgi:hypothetical protein
MSLIASIAISNPRSTPILPLTLDIKAKGILEENLCKSKSKIATKKKKKKQKKKDLIIKFTG